jgi:acyl-coenzyme A synthetase/AMP-(fatty) acid ligase
MMWNWFVSGLAVGATLVLYDGSPFHPDGNGLWDLADEVGISVFGTSAKWISAIEKAGVKPRTTHKLQQLKTILSTGSPLAPESYDYVYRDVKERVLLASISGGTDIISCFALGNPLLPVYRGELQSRGLGMKVEILDESGQPVREQPGELACSAPFPSMPVMNAVASPRFTGCRTTWSTPSSRARAAVSSVDPSSTISHSTQSKPSTSRGIVASAAPRVAASLRHGIWMISFMLDASPRRRSGSELAA